MSKIKSIPNNWKLLEFGEFAERKSNKHNPKTADIGMPCLELEHFEQGTGKIIGFVDSLNQASIKNVFDKGEVLFGKLRPYLRKYWFTEFEGVCSSEVWVLTGKKNTHNKYLFYLVQQHKFIETCNKTTGSKMPRADWKTVEVEPFLLPPLPEQQKIATILSKWDELIETQTQLIEEKEKQKKGLMQKLLTGEVRFPGFEEEWEKVTLGDIGKVKMCKRIFNNETSPEGEIPFYKIGTFGKEAGAFINAEIYKEYRSKYSFPLKGDILISAAGTLGRTVIYDGKPAYFQDSNIVWIAHDNSKILNEYLFFVYKIIRYDSEGGTIQRLYNSIITNAKLLLPSISEQKKISSTLNAIDEEIQSLKEKLEAIKLQKKGLMQQMLTGKIRVKI